MSATVNVYERMSRIQDCLDDLERAGSLAMIGAEHGESDDAAANDVRNMFWVVEELIGQARRRIEELTDEVRAVTKPSEPTAAKKGGR
jgi:hypothetical protein